MTPLQADAVPALSGPMKFVLPPHADVRTPTGNRITAVRRSSVPVVQCRVSFPVVGADPAVSYVLAEMLLNDTVSTPADEYFAALGGRVFTTVDQDSVAVTFSAFSGCFTDAVQRAAELLTSDAGYSQSNTESEVLRLTQELAELRADPDIRVAEMLTAAAWGAHPYAHDMPTAEELSAVTATEVLTLRSRVTAFGADVVVVGDVDPEYAVAAASDALGSSRRDRYLLPDRPDPIVPGSSEVADSSLSQSSVRYIADGVRRSEDSYAAYLVAVLAFGGQTGRWAEDIRERRGLTYSGDLRVDHRRLGSYTFLEFDTGPDTTDAAVELTEQHLARYQDQPVTADEFERARGFAAGSAALAVSSADGMMTALTAASESGLALGWYADHIEMLGELTVGDVRAAAEVLQPEAFTRVLLRGGSAKRHPECRT